MSKHFLAMLVLGFLAILSACSTPAATGTLQVDISGLPAGVNASVKVVGPGSSKDLTATSTLSAQPLGSYTVTAAPVSSGGVTFDATVSSSPASVVANATATVKVTYAISPASLGTLQVNLTVPGGGNGNVSISGPNGFSQTVNATTTLSGLVPGAYTLKANDIQGAGTSANFTLGGTVTGNSTVVASSTATATVTYAPTTGAITITVNGLPAGVNAKIAVVGASSGFNTTVTANTTLTGLKPDNYFVTTLNVRSSGAIVDTVFVSNDGNELDVGKGQLKSTVVNYTQRSGTGRLYVPVSGSIAGFSVAQLNGPDGAITPVSSVPNAGANESVVFDSEGLMYVSNFSNNSIKVFVPSSSSSGFTEVRTISGTNTGLNQPTGMAFDTSGKLWVVNSNNALRAFTRNQLFTGGDLTPETTITSAAFNNPVGIAFDASGNLWVTNLNPLNPVIALMRFVPNQLTSSGAKTPNGSVATSAAFKSAVGLAFDAQGNLWAVSRLDNTVLKFAQSDLNGLQNNQALAPTVTLEITGPRGLAFDNTGSLWVSTEVSIRRIVAANLNTNGTPTFAVTISNLGISLGGIAFNPAPSNLPIQNK